MPKLLREAIRAITEQPRDLAGLGGRLELDPIAVLVTYRLALDEVLDVILLRENPHISNVNFGTMQGYQTVTFKLGIRPGLSFEDARSDAEEVLRSVIRH